MSKLKKPISFETTFGTYTVDELIGEGGAGRVFGGIGIDDAPIALKVLTVDRSSTEKRKRFKNEIAFLAKNNHENIVTVLDHGLSVTGDIVGPFYVMRRYAGNLRDAMKSANRPDDAMALFAQILDGVEAAHRKGVIHCDLKPENILHDVTSNTVAIADFGTARFTEEELAATTIETASGQRLANFQYAAPEQRGRGGVVGAGADIYALGLILNQMFTGVVPHGTGYRSIKQAAESYEFLDEIVARMMRQSPDERPSSISNVKMLIQRQREEAVTLQRLSAINGTVIPAKEIDEPLAETAPRLIGADWNDSVLTLTLDRPVTPQWIQALHGMRGYSSVMGKPPQSFSIQGNKATVGAAEHEAQHIVNHFKNWLPTASLTLKNNLQEAARREEAAQLEQLRRERELEERRLRVNRNLTI